MPTPLTVPPAAFELRAAPRLRWGIIGPGAIARDWTRTVHANTDQRVAAVASRSAEKGRAFAAEHGIERVHTTVDALCTDDEIDVIYISSPHPLHREHALAAIAAGKPVLIEKPIAMSAAEATEIAHAARAANVFAMEAMWSRFLPQMRLVDDVLRSGVLGPLRHVSAEFSSRATFDPHSRLFDPALGGGALLDIGVYPLWFTTWVLGAPHLAHASGLHAETGVDSDATVLLRAAGATAVARTSVLATAPHRAGLFGEHGRLELDAPFWSPSGLTLTLQSPRGDLEVSRWTDPTSLRGRDGLAYQAVAVAEHLAAGRTEAPEHPLATSIRVMRLIDEARALIDAG